MNASALAADLDLALNDGNLVQIKADPVAEADHLAEINRRLVVKHEKRAADTRKALKAKLAAIATDNRALKLAYDGSVAMNAKRAAQEKETAQGWIAADLDTAARARAFLK
jgi:hypothetical protein